MGRPVELQPAAQPVPGALAAGDGRRPRRRSRGRRARSGCWRGRRRHRWWRSAPRCAGPARRGTGRRAGPRPARRRRSRAPCAANRSRARPRPTARRRACRYRARSRPALLDQLPQRFAQRAAADIEPLRQRGLDQRRAGRDVARQNRRSCSRSTTWARSVLFGHGIERGRMKASWVRLCRQRISQSVESGASLIRLVAEELARHADLHPIALLVGLALQRHVEVDGTMMPSPNSSWISSFQVVP